MIDIDAIFIHRAIELAKRGAGSVSTNPMVGCVIVHNNKIIGEGYHKKYGDNHAEVNAINSVKNQHLLPYSTLYVSLEPCSHWGKTPPCSELIIQKGIKRVVVAMQDPFAEVCGRGLEMMRNSGIDVTLGVLEHEAMELNRRFITYHEKRRPYIILKWATTRDGYIDSNRDASKPAPWITNHACKILVHRWRSEEDAIWVGKNTVLRDNPTLTVREWFGRNPIRISMDNTDTIDSKYNICNEDAETIIFKGKTIEQMLSELYERGIQSILVEGGRQLLNELIVKGLYDEIREFISPISIKQLSDGAISGTKAPKIINAKLLSSNKIGEIVLNRYYNSVVK